MEWLGALRDGAEAPAGWSAGTPRADEPWEDALERFTQLRGRNFGALQRRGLEVWDWKARHGEHGEVTAFQFLSAAVRRDAANLASARTLSAAGREAEC